MKNELNKIITNYKTTANLEKTLQNKHKDLYSKIINQTIMLSPCKFMERIFFIQQDLKEKPICYNCSASVRFKNSKKGYSIFCSNHCAHLSGVIKEKQKKTLQQRYGVNNPSYISNFHDKRKQTCQLKYGTDYANQNKFVREKIIKAWKKNQTQIKKTYQNTCFNKYGVLHPSQNKRIIEKRESTCIEKYGVTNPNKLIKYKENLSKQHLFNAYKKFTKYAPLFKKAEYMGAGGEYRWCCKNCSTIFNSSAYKWPLNY